MKLPCLNDDATPVGTQLQIIAGNYVTHKHSKMQRWLRRYRIFILTSRRPLPPGSPWSNVLFATSPRTACGTVFSAASSISLTPSTITSAKTYPTPKPFAGRPKSRTTSQSHPRLPHPQYKLIHMEHYSSTSATRYASRLSSLAPARECPHRERFRCFGFYEHTEKPHFTRVSIPQRVVSRPARWLSSLPICGHTSQH